MHAQFMFSMIFAYSQSERLIGMFIHTYTHKYTYRIYPFACAHVRTDIYYVRGCILQARVILLCFTFVRNVSLKP
jgi:hypothetical protein